MLDKVATGPSDLVEGSPILSLHATSDTESDGQQGDTAAATPEATLGLAAMVPKTTVGSAAVAPRTTAASAAVFLKSTPRSAVAVPKKDSESATAVSKMSVKSATAAPKTATKSVVVSLKSIPESAMKSHWSSPRFAEPARPASVSRARKQEDSPCRRRDSPPRKQVQRGDADSNRRPTCVDDAEEYRRYQEFIRHEERTGHRVQCRWR